MRSSLDTSPGIAKHLAHSRDVGFDLCSELLWRVADDIDAGFIEPFLTSIWLMTRTTPDAAG
jgi:hypothetical protein